ncbi:glycosyltransferase family 4 protein [Dongia deserti]|uniref:glycosyltransferase family 4 protein n=1 Tax=Dongia deserti TaxID=2268030 RepID=UPI002547CEBB|nr:glycosyltransferase family 4 protein [Dongia deserti]
MQNQVWQLVRSLDSAGISQTIVTTYIPGSPREYRLLSATTVKCPGPSLPAFLAGHFLTASWFLALIPYLLLNLRKFDIVHLHFDHSIWCRLLAVLIKLADMPVVVSLNVSLLSDGEGSDRGNRIARWLERCALRAADRVIALTRRQSETVRRLLPGHGDRVWIIPDAIDAQAFAEGIDAQAMQAFRTRYAIPEGMPVVAYIGRISEEKGWRDLPLLAQRLTSAGKFVLICGDGPRRKQLEKSLRSACGDDLHWCVTGFIPQQEVKAALRVADVIMLPSRREAFGSILLEAMALEVAAVAYGVGGIVDVAGEPNAISLVSPRDTEEFLTKVFQVLNDRDLRRDLVSRGRQRVQAFSVHLAQQQFLRLYRGIEPRGSLRPSEMGAGN